MHQVSTHIPGTRAAQVITRGPTATSADWSGYVDVAVPGRHFTSISSSFTIPSVNCAKSPDGSFTDSWVGLDGWSDNTTEKIGVDASCFGGVASYLAFYQMSPLPGVAFTGVSPGDAVNASVIYHAPNWILTLTDITTGGTITTAQTCPARSTCQNSSAEVITEDPKGPSGSVLPLTDFGEANYLNASVTALFGPFSITGTLASEVGLWTSTAVRMVNGADTLAVPSTLEGGKAFDVMWQASQ